MTAAEAAPNSNSNILFASAIWITLTVDYEINVKAFTWKWNYDWAYFCTLKSYLIAKTILINYLRNQIRYRLKENYIRNWDLKWRLYYFTLLLRYRRSYQDTDELLLRYRRAPTKIHTVIIAITSWGGSSSPFNLSMRTWNRGCPDCSPKLVRASRTVWWLRDTGLSLDIIYRIIYINNFGKCSGDWCIVFR